LTPFAAPRHSIDSVVDFSISADSSGVPRASSWLGETGSLGGIPAEPLWRLDLCVTEALANVIDHGGAGAADRPIRLRLEVHRGAGGGEASVTVSDGGAAFNPLTAAPKPRARTLSEAEPGGQGLTLLRRFADALDYSYSEAQNHLRIQVRWDQDKEGMAG
jgi:anti-sigma regulatory factor (Ser/Thr protein kinase)